MGFALGYKIKSVTCCQLLAIESLAIQLRVNITQSVEPIKPVESGLLVLRLRDIPSHREYRASRHPVAH